MKMAEIYGYPTEKMFKCATFFCRKGRDKNQCESGRAENMIFFGPFGHNHDSELFLGIGKEEGGSKLLEIKTGAQAKSNRLTCGDQSHIDSQYNANKNSLINWEVLFHSNSFGSFGVILEKNKMTVSFIQENGGVLFDYKVEKERKGCCQLKTTTKPKFDDVDCSKGDPNTPEMCTWETPYRGNRRSCEWAEREECTDPSRCRLYGEICREHKDCCEGFCNRKWDFCTKPSV